MDMSPDVEHLTVRKGGVHMSVTVSRVERAFHHR